MRDPVVIGFTIGLIVLMLVMDIGFSQLLAPTTVGLDWSRPLYLVKDATICPRREGAEWVYNHPAQRDQCMRWSIAEPVTILDRQDLPWVRIRTRYGQQGWTWMDQVHN